MTASEADEDDHELPPLEPVAAAIAAALSSPTMRRQPVLGGRGLGVQARLPSRSLRSTRLSRLSDGVPASDAADPALRIDRTRDHRPAVAARDEELDPVAAAESAPSRGADRR